MKKESERLSQEINQNDSNKLGKTVKGLKPGVTVDRVV